MTIDPKLKILVHLGAKHGLGCVLFLLSYFFYLFRINSYYLSISTDAWGILVSSRSILEGGFSGDPNKTFSILIGLIPAYFNSPELFPYITALFGAATCTAVFLTVESLAKKRISSLIAWGIAINCPVLTWQILSCNSLVFATCFLMGSLNYFCRKKIKKGCVFLTLAAFSRPEPFILILPILGYCFYQWQKGNLTKKELFFNFVLLASAPLWWLFFNLTQTGDPISGLISIQEYAQSVPDIYRVNEFFRNLRHLLTTYYMDFFPIAIAAAGFAFLFIRIKKVFFLYIFSISNLFGYWFLANNLSQFVLVERFLLPFYLYLVIFSVLLLDYGIQKLELIFSKNSYSLVWVYISVLTFYSLYLNMDQHKRIANILGYHAKFDRAILETTSILKDDLAHVDRLTILVSSRRHNMLRWHMQEFNDRISLKSFRSLQTGNSDLRKESVDLVILARGDFHSRPSAVYNLNLLSLEGLKAQKLCYNKIIPISEGTLIFKITRESDCSKGT